MRSEDTIREAKESAKETADELDDEGQPLDALMAQAVYKTIRWVEGEGPEDLEEGLLEIRDEEE